MITASVWPASELIKRETCFIRAPKKNEGSSFCCYKTKIQIVRIQSVDRNLVSVDIGKRISSFVEWILVLVAEISNFDDYIAVSY